MQHHKCIAEQAIFLAMRTCSTVTAKCLLLSLCNFGCAHINQLQCVECFEMLC